MPPWGGGSGWDALRGRPFWNLGVRGCPALGALPWVLPGCCSGAAWVLPGCCLGAAWVLPGCCLGAAWVLPGCCLGEDTRVQNLNLNDPACQ